MNVLFITADQWRADLQERAAALGRPLENLATLAREGTSFLDHYGQAQPCGPSRASLYTGLYAHKHRSVFNGAPLDRRHATLFQQARATGYRPVLFGFTDTTLDTRGQFPADPDCGNFENVAPGLAVETLLTARATPWLASLKAKNIPVPRPELGREGMFAQRALGDPPVFAPEDSETAFLTDRFLRWLSVPECRPWFAHLSYIAPHPPFAAQARFRPNPRDVLEALAARPAPPREIAPHPLVAALRATQTTRKSIPGLDMPVHALTLEQRATVEACYVGLAAEVDHHLGRVFSALKLAGEWDHTMIVFTSDHGEQLFEHDLLGKSSFYDGGARVPLILRHPSPDFDAGRGARLACFSEAVDLMPTLLNALGAPAPANVDGYSLLPWCAGKTVPDWRDEVHWHCDFRALRPWFASQGSSLPETGCSLQVIRSAGLKYVHFPYLPPALFDLRADPGERENIAARPEAATLLNEGMARMLDWRCKTEEHCDWTAA
ncbi:MAG: sulfatase-like hydrolase/transferase [Candidatus Accumulibacter sp.]|jgi:arylsulfatase A-like enzyme|nr:sulfatase-like hydrolase/transferase [Accumulibacter sp.]